MQFLKTLSTLAIAHTVVAAPAPAPEPDNQDPRFWSIVGWGNPNCKGHVVWHRVGSEGGCHDMPLLAASYTWAVTRKTGVQSVPEPGICMVADWSSKAHLTDISVGRQDRHFEQNCANVPIMSFRIKVDAD